MSGAELSALISAAAMNAIRAVILNAETKTNGICIERQHIELALQKTVKND